MCLESNEEIEQDENNKQVEQTYAVTQKPNKIMMRHITACVLWLLSLSCGMSAVTFSPFMLRSRGHEPCAELELPCRHKTEGVCPEIIPLPVNNVHCPAGGAEIKCDHQRAFVCNGNTTCPQTIPLAPGNICVNGGVRIVCGNVTTATATTTVRRPTGVPGTCAVVPAPVPCPGGLTTIQINCSAATSFPPTQRFCGCTQKAALGAIVLTCPATTNNIVCNGLPGPRGAAGLNGTCPLHCNVTGPPGPPGPPGRNGTNGAPAVCVLVNAPGACPDGANGQRLQCNGMLTGSPICNGTRGERGFNGSTGATGRNGTNGVCPQNCTLPATGSVTCGSLTFPTVAPGTLYPLTNIFMPGTGGLSCNLTTNVTVITQPGRYLFNYMFRPYVAGAGTAFLLSAYAELYFTPAPLFVTRRQQGGIGLLQDIALSDDNTFAEYEQLLSFSNSMALEIGTVPTTVGLINGGSVAVAISTQDAGPSVLLSVVRIG